MTITLTMYGHATYGLDIDGAKLVIDPFFAGNNPQATVKQEEVEADFVLVSHGHGDHIADAVPLATRTGALTIANFEIVGWLGKQGVKNAHPQHIGGGFNHPFGYLKFIHAQHGSGLPDGSYGGNPAGFLIETGGKRLYFACDTALYSDMALVAEGGLDLAVLPIGDNFTMGPGDALRAVRDYLKPKLVVPCHYNTWPYIEQDGDKWVADVNALGLDTEAVVLPPNGTLSI